MVRRQAGHHLASQRAILVSLGFMEDIISTVQDRVAQLQLPPVAF